jgi:3-mercaptopyruvate sulfurtransferase SseA
MKRLFVFALIAAFALGSAGLAVAEDNPLRAAEKAVNKSFEDAIPDDRFIDAAKFKAVYDEVVAGKRDAFLIDVRTHPEFYAFHIEGSDHIHAGHVYTIAKKIKDPNAEIYIY